MEQHLLIEGYKLPTANQLYSQGHWSARKKLKDRWSTIVKSEARHQGIRKVGRYPVEIEVLAFFGPGERRFDAGNLHAVEKLVTDSLVTEGILKNDSPKYVRRVLLGPIQRDPETTYVQYIIRQTNGEHP